MEKKIKNWFPPGFDYKNEIRALFIVLGCGFLISLSFLIQLDNQVDALYIRIGDGKKALAQGVISDSFVNLARESLWWLGLTLLYPFCTVIDHYYYYYRNVRCIYLMKRLPDKGFMAKTCIKGSLAELGVWFVAVLLVYLFYYAIYCLRIPEACMPRFL